MRGWLREHGHSIPVGARTVLRRVTAILEDAAVELPDVLLHTVALVVDVVREFEARLVALNRQLAQMAATHPVATRLQTIPGVGVLTATALVGAVNHSHAFRRGREFASWLELTPRESSSGGHRYLSRISKRGDVHLRSLLAHGARAVLRTALRRADRTSDQLTRLQQWAVTTATHRGRNKATIAVANKLARIVWAVWRTDDVFHARPRLTTVA